MLEGMIEHAPDRANGFLVAGIRIPANQRVQEGAEHHGGIVLPVGTLQRLAVEDGVDQVNLQTGPAARVVRDFMLDKVPAEMKNFVVPSIFVRLIPRKQLAVRVHHGRMPRQLSVDILLARQRSARERAKNGHEG